MTRRGWDYWEKQVNTDLGLDSTIASGNKWYDLFDGVDRTQNSPFPLAVDAKYTGNQSYTVKAKDIRQYVSKAMEAGKKFALPIRLWPERDEHPTDLVVLTYDDFQELMASILMPSEPEKDPLPVLDEEDHKFFQHLSKHLEPFPFKVKVIQLYAKLRGEPVEGG